MPRTPRHLAVRPTPPPALPSRTLKAVTNRPKRPAKETRRSKWLRVIPPRVQAAVKALELVGYGGAKERYAYTADDAQVVEKVLRAALDKALVAYGIVPNVQGGIGSSEILGALDQAELDVAEAIAKVRGLIAQRNPTVPDLQALLSKR